MRHGNLESILKEFLFYFFLNQKSFITECGVYIWGRNSQRGKICVWDVVMRKIWSNVYQI